MGLGGFFRSTRNFVLGKPKDRNAEVDPDTILRGSIGTDRYNKANEEIDRANETADILNSQRDIKTSILSSARQTSPIEEQRKLLKNTGNRRKADLARGGAGL